MTLDEAVEEALTNPYKENQHFVYQASTEAVDHKTESSVYTVTIFLIYNICTNTVGQITSYIDKAIFGATYDPR